MVEARSLYIIVSSDHPSADEQVAEAIARVVSCYAVDLRPAVEVNVPQGGIKITYVAKAAMRFSSHLRAARRARIGSTNWMAKHQSAPATTSSAPKNSSWLAALDELAEEFLAFQRRRAAAASTAHAAPAGLTAEEIALVEASATKYINP